MAFRVCSETRSCRGGVSLQQMSRRRSHCQGFHQRQSGADSTNRSSFLEGTIECTHATAKVNKTCDRSVRFPNNTLGQLSTHHAVLERCAHSVESPCHRPRSQLGGRPIGERVSNEVTDNTYVREVRRPSAGVHQQEDGRQQASHRPGAQRHAPFPRSSVKKLPPGSSLGVRSGPVRCRSHVQADVSRSRFETNSGRA